MRRVAVDVDEHLEEVDLGEIARPIRQRHEDLAALPLPLRDRVLDDRDADAVALGHQQLVQPRRRQPLLAARPLRRLGQQRLDPRGRPRPTPAAARGRRCLPHRRRLVQYFRDRHPRQSQLPRHRPLRPALHQHLVPDDMHLIHPEHPPSGPRIPRSGKPAIRPSGGLLSERRMVYFLSGAPTLVILTTCRSAARGGPITRRSQAPRPLGGSSGLLGAVLYSVRSELVSLSRRRLSTFCPRCSEANLMITS